MKNKFRKVIYKRFGQHGKIGWDNFWDKISKSNPDIKIIDRYKNYLDWEILMKNDKSLWNWSFIENYIEYIIFPTFIMDCKLPENLLGDIVENLQTILDRGRYNYFLLYLIFQYRKPGLEFYRKHREAIRKVYNFDEGYEIIDEYEREISKTTV